MNFTSLGFLLFITAFTAGFMMLARTRLFTPLLLVSSYIFYGFWDYRFCLLLAGTTLLDFYCGLRIADAPNRATARIFMQLSLATNLAILFFFKYFNFFIDSAQVALASLGLDVGHRTLSIILPVGISFYTFQNLSYTLDLYLGHLDKPERSLLRYATFVAFFPQLVAGPIVRARDLLPQIQNGPRHDVSFALRFAGLEKIIWGYFLKLGLADNAAAVVDARFAQPEFFNALNHVIGLICFSLQIYGDFAGYSLIAIGLAQIFGYTLCQNFARPYFATGMKDFWRRWHISLSTWFRDYVYIPMGGGRTHWLRIRNLTIVMLVSGLWHGAAWTFVLWGALHATLMAAEDGVRWLARRSPLRLSGAPLMAGKLLTIALVFLLITLTWLPFRADDMHTVRTILGIIAEGDFSLPRGMQQMSYLVRVALFGLVVLMIDAMIEFGAGRRYAGVNVVVRSAGCATLILMLLLFGNFANRSFIYFQF
ncbi:MBOAT family protein [Azospirillum formosense]|uniref:Probable alginate O-acetylase AlgI n=1 Tax=Azospirillum formosense TaxID=861533 RepID=A0ABX2L3X3_9PROT|nr:MBOAT family protein [Azospirillum formosense]MBY3753632.1 MBOAT family protein [Azospirillum formosense]NUB21587.1 MBOAT family protein [Azospirillum formosense]